MTDIILDTGSARTIIRSDLVPEERKTGGEIPIRCAHGDTIIYPLAQAEIRVGEACYMVEAAVSKTLPVSVLLGRDVPELMKLLSTQGPQKARGPEDAMAVTTRGQKEKLARETVAQIKREQESGAVPKPVFQQTDESLCQEASTEDEVPESNFDQDLFQTSKQKKKQTRREKRTHNLQYMQEKEPRHPLDMRAEELRSLQQSHESLAAVRKAAKGEDSTAGGGFFERDGLLYRRWIPPGRGGEDMATEQLVLPASCRQAVLNLAHEIPLAGHMGQRKTAKRVLQRFYWPTVWWICACVDLRVVAIF